MLTGRTTYSGCTNVVVRVLDLAGICVFSHDLWRIFFVSHRCYLYCECIMLKFVDSIRDGEHAV